MPIYEFECGTCGGRTEEHRSLSDRDRNTKCSSCGKTAHRIMSLTASPVFAAGIYASSVKEHADKQRARLLKRSAEHDRTKGKDEIQHNTERAMRQFRGDV